jgi:hypothetical protein
LWWSDLQTLLFGIFVGAILAFASYLVLRAINTWPGLRCHNLGTVQFSALVMHSLGRSRIEK